MQTSKSILNCECGTKLEVKICRFLDVTAQPELEGELVRGELNAAKCHNCGKVKYIDEPFTYYDAGREASIRVLPSSWRKEQEAVDLSSDGKLWTRTFYGLGALINFIAAESNVPRKYRDQVAEQAQMIEDEYHAISESRCGCGHPFKVKRSVVRSFRQGPIEILKARCTGCGGARTFFFPMPYTIWQKKRLETPVPVNV